MATKPRLTKAEQKRQRIEAARAALARAQRRRRNLRLGLTAAAVVMVIAIVVVAVVALRGSKSPTPAAVPTAAATSTAPTAAPGRTSAPPWPAPANPAELVAAAGLPMLGEEGSALHIHTHLDVIVDGKPVTVPAQIGIDESTQKISPLHTHDTTGIIHIESPTQVPVTPSSAPHRAPSQGSMPRPSRTRNAQGQPGGITRRPCGGGASTNARRASRTARTRGSSRPVSPRPRSSDRTQATQLPLPHLGHPEGKFRHGTDDRAHLRGEDHEAHHNDPPDTPYHQAGRASQHHAHRQKRPHLTGLTVS